MQLFYDWCSYDSEKEQVEEDYDNDEEMIVDCELQEALRLSLKCPRQQLCAFTEEIHLKRALSESLSIKQPYFSSAMEKLCALIFPVKDLFIPILVERGNLRDLVSFCSINTGNYRIYKDIEEKCLVSMLEYRIIPHSKLRGTYKQPDYRILFGSHKQQDSKSFSRILCYKTGREVHCKWPFVVALCDAAYSLKTDTRIYIRETKPEPPYDGKEDIYFHQDMVKTPFKNGLCSNEKVKQLMDRNGPAYRIQLLMG